MTTTLVILVDRAVSSITSIAEAQRELAAPFSPFMRFLRRALLCRLLASEPLGCFPRRPPNSAAYVQ